MNWMHDFFIGDDNDNTTNATKIVIELKRRIFLLINIINLFII